VLRLPRRPIPEPFRDQRRAPCTAHHHGDRTGGVRRTRPPEAGAGLPARAAEDPQPGRRRAGPRAPVQQRDGFAPCLFPGDQRGLAGDVQAARPDRQGDSGRHPARGRPVLHQEQPRRGHAGQAGGWGGEGQAMTHERLTLRLIVLLVCATLLAACTTLPPTTGDPRAMKFDPVTFTIPEVERIVLENGIIVYLLPDLELPLVALEAIRRRPDSPAGIAGREFRKLLYGADHPLGRESTIETVSRITRDDLVDFHRQYFTPSGLILGVTGDFEKPAMLDVLRKVFGDWKPQPVTLPAI